MSDLIISFNCWTRLFGLNVAEEDGVLVIHLW